MKKIMRLKPRDGSAEITKEIGGFREDGFGYRVQGTNGEDLGYFGPDKYESIVFEVHWPIDPSPR